MRTYRSVFGQRAGWTKRLKFYRFTGDQAQWFGIDAGRIRKGDQADIVVIDPEAFGQDPEQVHWAEMENFDIRRLVNRSPGLVQYVMIEGKIAVDDENLAPELGKVRGYGQFIPAR
ncbi:amidohydrolase family protein [Thalassotalea sp. G20_0]|uniref:amidohydrolase family protein n=1 Tax=Thalassotalea sp. G20_0 TaxID=2821093 RepID=UPI001ADB400A|nr:amidohydrolase family protein [Thalassotalea sp. G20_0]MBO9493398.1 amidohydrolase family protein [Thalassotalea sp. G20_0]